MRNPEQVTPQRVRARFGRGEALAHISHLDLMRFWERALRRAGLPLAYSQGFTPHPRISMAAPLAVSVTSEAEIMDVYLSRWVAPQTFLQALRRQMPPGIEVYDASVVPLDMPSLQSQVRFAEYRVIAGKLEGPADVSGAISKLVAERNIAWHHTRDNSVRTYDLRPLISGLWLIGQNGDDVVIGMKLRSDPSGAGRPEQVLAALGFTHPPKVIHRTRLFLETPRGQRR